MRNGLSIVMVENPDGCVGIQAVESISEAEDLYENCHRCGIPESRMTLISLEYKDGCVETSAKVKIIKK